jgi:hypothetical protein
MHRLIKITVLLPVFSVLGGCASLKHPVEIDWEHSAKRGAIMQIYDANTPVTQLPACLAKLPAGEIARHRYAEIRYLHRRTHFHEVGDLPAGVNAKGGDMVEFYPKSCDDGSLATISRVLPSVAVP